MNHIRTTGKGRVAIGLLGAIGSLYAVSNMSGCDADPTAEQKQILDDEKALIPTERNLKRKVHLTTGADLWFDRSYDENERSERIRVTTGNVILHSKTVANDGYSFVLDQVFLNEGGVLKKYESAQLGDKYAEWQKVFDDSIHQGRAEMKYNGFGLDNALDATQKAIRPTKAERTVTTSGISG